MTHERLLELVWQVDLALAMSCGAFVLYEAVSKSASSADLKSKLDLKRGQLLSSTILEIEEVLRPYWSARASRIIIEPEFKEETPTVFSDDARDALRNCLDESDCLRKAVKIRGIAMRVSRWDRICYWCLATTAILAIIGLAVRFFYDGMSDRVAESAILIPVSPAVLGILSAVKRQVHVHRANDAIVQEDE
jgi:hypothetical protein